MQLVFVGDSLTARWPRSLWDASFGRFGALNLGVGGDRTEWSLWRLQAMDWGDDEEALRPRVAVVLIGTNNLSKGSEPENVAAGIYSIIRLIQERSPATRILLLALWPRTGNDRLQRRLGQLNEILSRCARPPELTVLDLGPVLRGANGGPDDRYYLDGLHLSRDGYERVAEVLAPRIAAMLGETIPSAR